LDEHVFLSINQWAGTLGMDHEIKFISDIALPIRIVTPISLYTLGLIRHDYTQALGGLTVGIGQGVSSLVTEGLKALVQRPRPFHVIEGTRTPFDGATGYSFPSGHSTATWALVAALSFEYPKWYLVVPAVALATLVSLTRPCLGDHYVSDLLAGAVVAVGCTYIVHRNEALIARIFTHILPDPHSPLAPGMTIAPTLGPDLNGFTIAIPFGE